MTSDWVVPDVLNHPTLMIDAVDSAGNTINNGPYFDHAAYEDPANPNNSFKGWVSAQLVPPQSIKMEFAHAITVIKE
jgi:hypothetical protein